MGEICVELQWLPLQRCTGAELLHYCGHPVLGKHKLHGPPLMRPRDFNCVKTLHVGLGVALIQTAVITNLFKHSLQLMAASKPSSSMHVNLIVSSIAVVSLVQWNDIHFRAFRSWIQFTCFAWGYLFS